MWTDGGTERRTVMTTLVVSFRNFANASKWTKKEVRHPILFCGIKVKPARRNST
jgi:hypothetical protein